MPEPWLGIPFGLGAPQPRKGSPAVALASTRYALRYPNNGTKSENDAVDRLDDARPVEHGQLGGDLHWGSAVDLLEEKNIRLGDQPAGLAEPFENI